MNYIDDFNSLAPFFFYPGLVGLLSITIFLCGIKKFAGPIAFASLYLYGGTLLMAGAGGALLLQAAFLNLIFLVFLYLGGRISLSRYSHLVTIGPSATLTTKLLSFMIVVTYVLILTYVLINFAVSFKLDKINWVTNAGFLPYLLALLNGMMLTYAFIFLASKNYTLFLLLIFVLIAGGYVFGEKITLLNMAILIVTVMMQKPRIRPRVVVYSISIVVLFFALTLYFFGANEGGIDNALTALLIRLIATFDGTMIILSLELHESYLLPHDFLYYVFDFITSKIFGPTQGVGQILAGTNVYNYPPNGGPNDSLINYFLLSSGLNKVLVCVFLAASSFLLGYLDRVIKQGKINSYAFGWKLILIPLYFMLPAFFQATGTAFLLLARYYFLLLPSLIFVYIITIGIKSDRN